MQKIVHQAALLGMALLAAAPLHHVQRARLSADGRLLTCLFAADGVALKPLLRGQPGPEGDAALRTLLSETWRARNDRYSQEREQQDARRPRRRLEMYQVGG